MFPEPFDWDRFCSVVVVKKPSICIESHSDSSVLVSWVYFPGIEQCFPKAY